HIQQFLLHLLVNSKWMQYKPLKLFLIIPPLYVFHKTMLSDFGLAIILNILVNNAYIFCLKE
ncbi:MAG: hypothetical protein KKB77_03335, partial [Bacteroidetes bacterium]|nr:hypothetical protein [Bacteroidota bacterium]